MASVSKSMTNTFCAFSALRKQSQQVGVPYIDRPIYTIWNFILEVPGPVFRRYSWIPQVFRECLERDHSRLGHLIPNPSIRHTTQHENGMMFAVLPIKHLPTSTWV
jgi:hypothetical protein